MSLAERIQEAMGTKRPSELARAVGVTNAAVTQWLDGSTKSLKSETAALLERATGYRASWIVTGKGPKFADDPASRLTASEPPPNGLAPILAWQHPDDLPPGEFVLIPRLDLHLSAGPGKDQVEIEFVEKQPQAFRADWIRSQRLKPSKLACMVASGRSMEPRIWDGDSLVIDTSQTEIQDGRVYALWYEGGERVKRLFRLPGGGLRIQSDNPEFGTIELTGKYTGQVRIIGRVVHHSGTGGL